MPIIPQALQQKRITPPKTLSQMYAERQPQKQIQQYQQQATEIISQDTSQQEQEVAEKQKGLNQAINMAINNKSYSSSELSPYAKKYYDAIMWGNNAGFNSSERKILEQLHNEARGYGARERSQEVLTQSDILKGLYGAQRGEFQVPSTTPVLSTEPQIKGQYSAPIGPSRPLGYDTKGNPVFPEKIATKKSDVYIAPSWFGETPKATYETYRPVSIPQKNFFGMQTSEVQPFSTDEYYEPSSNTFASRPYGESQGTLFLRPPTLQEQARLDEIKNQDREMRQGIKGFVEKFTARGSGSDVWQKISTFTEENIKRPIEELGESISGTAFPSYAERLEEENYLSSMGENLSIKLESFNEKYSNMNMTENSPEYSAYLQELEQINFEIDNYNQQLASHEEKLETAQTERPSFFGVKLGEGAGEFATSFGVSTIQAPFQIASFLAGAVTDPVGEFSTIASGLSQLPSQAKKYPATTGGSILGMIAGGKMTSSLLSKGITKLKTPSYKTEFIGFTKEGGNAINLLFKTEESKVLGLFKKDYYGTAKAIIPKSATSEGVTASQVITGGKFRRYQGLNLGTLKGVYSEPTKFGSAGVGLTREATSDFDFLKGFASVDVGKIATKSKANYYGGVGGGYKLGNFPVVRVFGKSSLFEKGKSIKGTRGTYTGFIIERTTPKDSGVTSFLGGGSKSSQSFLNQLYSRAGAEVSSAVAKTRPVIKTKTGFGLPLISASLVETNYPTYTGGSRPYSDTIQTGLAKPSFFFEEDYSRGRIKTTPAFSDIISVGLTSRQPLMTEERVKQKEITSVGSALFQPSVTRQRTLQAVSFVQPSGSRNKQAQQQRQKQKELQRQSFTQVTSFIFPTEEKFQKEQGFEGYFKRGKKWIKATKPSTRKGALDSVSRIVDSNLSRQFKVLPIKQKIKGKEQFVKVEKQKLYKGDNYFQQNMFKFRPYRQVKGQKIGMQNQYIERTKYALEDREVPKIQRARLQSSMNSLIFGNNKKRKKNFRI